MRVLTIRAGNAPGESLRVKVNGFEVTRKQGRIVEGVVRHFSGHAAFIFKDKGRQRMFVIEPSEEENIYSAGSFFVRGGFRVVEKINNLREATERWKGFEAE